MSLLPIRYLSRLHNYEGPTYYLTIGPGNRILSTQKTLSWTIIILQQENSFKFIVSCRYVWQPPKSYRCVISQATRKWQFINSIRWFLTTFRSAGCQSVDRHQTWAIYRNRWFTSIWCDVTQDLGHINLSHVTFRFVIGHSAYKMFNLVVFFLIITF